MEVDAEGLINLIPEPEPPKCNSKTRAGGRCTQVAGFGTTHPGSGPCKFHGGATPAHVSKALIKQAERIAARMSVPIDIDPLNALLQCVRLAAGEEFYWRMYIEDLEERGIDMVGNPVQTLTRPLKLGGEDGEDPGSPVREVTELPVDLHIAVKAWHESTDRLAKFSKLAIDAGCDIRLVQLEEQKGALFASAVRGILEELGVVIDSVTSAVVRKHLTIIAGTAEEM